MPLHVFPKRLLACEGMRRPKWRIACARCRMVGLVYLAFQLERRR